MRILAIDDERLTQTFIQGVLEKEHQIHIATDGEQGIQLASELKPDMDGYEVCKKLKQNAATADSPLLFHSAHTDTKEQMQGYAAGANKPFLD